MCSSSLPHVQQVLFPDSSLSPRRVARLAPRFPLLGLWAQPRALRGRGPWLWLPSLLRPGSCVFLENLKPKPKRTLLIHDDDSTQATLSPVTLIPQVSSPSPALPSLRGAPPPPAPAPSPHAAGPCGHAHFFRSFRLPSAHGALALTRTWAGDLGITGKSSSPFNPIRTC